jgi:hypothetical protein
MGTVVIAADNPITGFFRCAPEVLAPQHIGYGVEIESLRHERYVQQKDSGLLAERYMSRAYYLLRPMMPVTIRRMLQRIYLRDWRDLNFPRWPVDTSVERLMERALNEILRTQGLDRVPFIWFWPDGARAAVMMTHDVETRSGLGRVGDLIGVDKEFGLRASYQLVPRGRYSVTAQLLDSIRKHGCEVNVHGLTHDGNEFHSREVFNRQFVQLGECAREFGAEGFRSACMYRNAEWLGDLPFQYDMSLPNVAHLEAQRGGCCTVFPFFIDNIVELPLTTVQDYSLFHVLQDYSTGIWKRQIEMIAQRHGLISFIVHPDYVFTPRAMATYRELMKYLSALRGVWTALPGELNRWWRQRSQMRIVGADGRLRIEGAGRERACLAWAIVRGEGVEYAVDSKQREMGQHD